MLIIFLLYVPKRYFFDVNVGKLEESSRTALPFRRVCLWRHNHFTREIGRVACHPPPVGDRLVILGESCGKLWIWEKKKWVCNGCGMPAGNAYPSGHLVPSLIVGLACAPIVQTKFLELDMSLLDFSHRIPLGTFSILLRYIRSGDRICSPNTRWW